MALITLLAGAVVFIGISLSVVFGLRLSGTQSNSTAFASATTLVAQAGVFKAAAELYYSRHPNVYIGGDVWYTFDGSAGFVSPQESGSVPPSPPSAALSGTGSGSRWVVRPTRQFKGVGTALPDPAMLLADVDLSTCTQFNVIANRVTLPLPPMVAYALAEIVVDPTAAYDDMDDPVDLGAGSDASYGPGWERGCLAATDGKYFVFQVLRAL